MSLRMDHDALLATVRALQRQAQRVGNAPLPGDDPAVLPAREAAATLAADLLDLADRLGGLVHDMAAREEAVAADCARLRRRWRRP